MENEKSQGCLLDTQVSYLWDSGTWKFHSLRLEEEKVIRIGQQGCGGREGSYATVLGMLSLSKLWDIEVHSEHRS